MSIVFWFLGVVIGAFVSIFITLAFQDSLKTWAAQLVTLLGARNDDGITGLWRTTFSYVHGRETTNYIECIEIRTLFGMVIGRIVPDPSNHPRLNDIAPSRPIRVRGQLKDNHYFTGIWLHPLQRHHYHGAFQLLLEPNGHRMKGRWIGFSNSKKSLEEGDWEWELITNRQSNESDRNA
jgi:hypothetical protein